MVSFIGSIVAPIIYMASVWWRTAHPDLNIGPLAESSLDTDMLMVWLYSTLVFTVFYVYLLIERISMRKAEDDIDEVYQYANFSS